jgi:uncharacterized protein YjbI with pentapeptide repeats
LGRGVQSGAYIFVSGANLMASNLSNANFSHAVLTDVNMEDTNLSGADFRYARAGFQDAPSGYWPAYGLLLNRADLTNANIVGANFTGVEVVGAVLTGVISDATTTCTDGKPGPCVGPNLSSR